MNDHTEAPQQQILERDPKPLQAHMEANTHLVDTTLDGMQSGFVGRLFPTTESREVREHELAQLQTGFEFRRRALRMAVDTKLQAVEEMCNHVLVTGKSEIRRQRQEFFAEQKLKLQEAMDDCADRFNQNTEKRFDALERMRVGRLREREEQRLLRSVDQFHDMLDQLGTEFMQIIQEGVSR